MTRGRLVIVWFVVAVLASGPGLARAAPVEPLPPPAGTTSSVGSLRYVTGIDDLARLTQEDDVLHRRALALSSRAKLGMGVMMGSVAAGALIIVAAATVFTQTECISPSVPPGFDLPVSPICQSTTNEPLAIAGLLTGIVGGVAGLALAPPQTEWYDIINEWNSRHPDRSLLIPPRSHHD